MKSSDAVSRTIVEMNELQREKKERNREETRKKNLVKDFRGIVLF